MQHARSLVLLKLGLAFAVVGAAGPARAAPTCTRTFEANVVALDQPLMFNRLGAQNVNGTIFALARDVVNVDSGKPLTKGGAPVPGRVALRPDKRPRPLVLRVAEGDCLTVNLRNLLTNVANPFNAEHAALQIDDQVAGRHVGFHVAGLEPFSKYDDGSYVGRNPSSLAAPAGGTRTYRYYAPHEGAYAVTNPGAAFGGEGSQGATATGLFAAVNVEPRGARFYRSQVTAEELELASNGKVSPTGQPLVDFDAVYPGAPSVWDAEGKGGLPVLRMTTGVTGGEIVHADLNAIIVGPEPDGRFLASSYPLERAGKNNPTLPNRLEPFREFTIVFHDEVPAAQAFPGIFDDPVFKYTLHGIRDAFMVNYGSGGVGAEVIANRLGVGPMHECLSCAYEEFFLTSFAVGDPAMLVDVPANVGLELVGPGEAPPAGTTGPKATRALFPDDPSNVHHGYTGDHVKFRNVHFGKEHHVFHLHNHQWLYNPNDDNSNYIDAQGIGPGSGYSYEINYGAGNRNKSSGDAIYHCHFYPHFAQGMWAHWRNHDVMEVGTRLAASGETFHATPFALRDGTPAPGARALPDGEIVAGTPIPAVIPLPGKAMPPMPGKVTVAPKPDTTVASALHGDPVVAGTVVPVGSVARVDRADKDGEGYLKNPGYPFWVAGIEDIVGQRPPSPPLDLLTTAQATALGSSTNPLFAGRGAELAAGAGGFDGGLPRHALHGYAAGGEAVTTTSRLDMSKVMKKAKPVFYPEEGTDLEQAAMRFHATRNHPSGAVLLRKDANGDPEWRYGQFVLNGQKPMPSAPYHEPCVDDAGELVVAGGAPRFFDGNGGLSSVGTVQRGARNPRTYKGAAIQIDAVFNKVGWHYPQERISALWEDVMPTIRKQRPPEPFVIRFNTLDCGHYLHTNLVPEFFELDDYQVRTPTDIIGQHIHLPKWDLTTTDGAANGWNYEDGTLAPGAVRERVHAINEWNAEAGPGAVKTLDGKATLAAAKHPFFPAGPVPGSQQWMGARTTIQRWFFDPVLNVHGQDRGLGIIFTHDHFGPSTHQQIGLYSSVLTEPMDSTWVHNESGVALGTRHDGGPTTWQAVIRSGPNGADSFREFWFQASDFQHAYEPGVYVGADQNGVPAPTRRPTQDTFRYTVNPPARAQHEPVLPDLVVWSAACPGGVPRPCPEAISAEDPGMFVVNYRNEPVGLRVYDPDKLGPDGKKGAQADGLAGDLAFALQSRSDRKIRSLNTILGNTPYPALTGGLGRGDPFTPMMRAAAGDRIRVRVQIGGHEEEHVTTIHGVKWLQSGSSFGEAGNSGWRNIQAQGISEQFTFSAPLTPFINSPRTTADYAYAMNPSEDGWWSGAWGILRTYDQNPRTGLVRLPNNPGRITNQTEFDVNAAGLCPRSAPRRTYAVSAVLANEVLPSVPGVTILPEGELPDWATQHVGTMLDPAGGTLVYNPRTTVLSDGKAGPIHDPTGMIYVFDSDLEPKHGPDDPGCNEVDAKTGLPELDINLPTCRVKLKAGVPVEPLVLRAAAGECLQVTLRNRLPGDLDGNGIFDDNPDLGTYTALMAIVARDRFSPNGVTTFNNNVIRASSHVGLHPQLVAYDVTKADGTNVGLNTQQTQSPGGARTIRWYMGDLRQEGTRLVATPLELGGVNLTPADKVKQGQKGLGGALVVLPPGSQWTEDPDRRAAASVGTDANGDGAITGAEVAFRDFAAVIMKNMTHRFADGSPVPSIGGGNNVITEDSQDSGQLAMNYGTEPLWFRFGLRANAPFGNTPGGLGAVANAHLAFSNELAGGDPATPVFRVRPGMPFRLHAGQPHGAFRGTVLELHGHVWQRDPYLCPGSADLGIAGKCAPGEVGSRALGVNPIGFTLAGQDGFHPYSHFDFYFPSAGGSYAAEGDWLFRDVAGLGVTSGLWSIVRTEGSAP